MSTQDCCRTPDPTNDGLVSQGRQARLRPLIPWPSRSRPSAADGHDQRPAVVTGAPLTTATAGISSELACADAWPYILPSWLSATEEALPDATPWHSIAQAGPRAVFLPGFLFTAPGLVDADPRTYLGWEPPTGETACCSARACCGTQSRVDALAESVFFPALVLGSPLGYRSDVAAIGEHDPQLTVDLLDHLVPAALGQGVRSIVAPWVSDRPVNGALLAALHRHGASVSFWGEENFVPLEHGSYAEHVAALPARKRRRVKEDQDKAAASGAEVTRVDGESLRPLVGRIAELTTLNRQKYDGSEGAEHVSRLLTALLDAGADVRTYLAHRDRVVVGSCVTIRQGRRLVVKWAGFDYAVLGERSGLYFSLVLDRPLQDAYAEGLDSLEAGPGADLAKRLRGCQPRPVYTALLVAEEGLRQEVVQLQALYGGARRGELHLETTKPELPQVSALPGDRAPAQGCCG